jgi:hypothetical protein
MQTQRRGFISTDTVFKGRCQRLICSISQEIIPSSPRTKPQRPHAPIQMAAIDAH